MTMTALQYTAAANTHRESVWGRLARAASRKHWGSVRSRATVRAGIWSKQFLAATLATMFFTSTALADTPQSIGDITNLPVEDLMNMQITTVSKHSQPVATAPAAIFVITQEDIQNSGARSIPELLRMVPGLEVARIDENKWAIGSRGFNGRFDDKLLVLIDGRSVYTPLFSGVYWDVEDVMLEDVERIEVIRGPGATLWGANAVDGVINIITKSSKDSQNLFVKSEGGDEQINADSVRYGGKIDNEGTYRVYAKYLDWNSSTGLNRQYAGDGYNQLRGGFRSDWNLTQKDALTFQGDTYHSRNGETLTIPTLTAPFYSSTFGNEGDYSGGNLLGRWTHTSNPSDKNSPTITLQTYFDRTNYADNNLFVDHENVFDVDFQHDFHVGERNDIVWGAGYRSVQDRSDSTFTVMVTPSQGQYNLFSAFAQDEVAVSNRLSVTVGSKFEHNSFTGFEIQPNIRFLAKVRDNQSVWGAISRAVRTPAITEEGLRLADAVVPPGVPPFNSPLPVIEAVYGSNLFKSEDLLAYEVGYRVDVNKSLSADISAFYNNYTNLRTAEPGAPFVEGGATPTDVVFPFLAENKMSGGSYGIEPFFDYKPLKNWKIFGSYSYLQMDIHKNANSLDPTADLPNGENPKNQVFISSSVELPLHFEQHFSYRYVDKLSSIGIPGYSSFDGGFSWNPMTNLRLSFDGQNWLDNRHLEFIPDFINTVPTVVTRTYYGSVTWSFDKR
ncbi:MAG TPA: TonB-dependent receptor [Candidatus Acidoferrales bacterium]